MVGRASAGRPKDHVILPVQVTFCFSALADPGTSFPTEDAMGFQNYKLKGKPDEGKGTVQCVIASTWHANVAQGGNFTPRSWPIRWKTNWGGFAKLICLTST